MIVSYFEYNGNNYEIGTSAFKEYGNMNAIFTVKVFLLGTDDKKEEVYSYTTENLTEANGRHLDIELYPELFVSKEAIEKHKQSKGSNSIDLYTESRGEESTKAEWIMAEDDYEEGWGFQKYPHCSKCNRGVYRHDAGSFCPFCGTPMKNPMR